MLGKEQENKGLGVDETGDDGDCLGRVDLEGSKGISKSMAKNETRELLAIQVLARMMDSSKGRDKVLKCIQYTLKTYLYLMSLFVRVRPLSPWFRANRKRMAIAVSGLSLTRKCLLLLTPLHPLSDLLSPAPISARTLLLHLVDLAGAVADDVFCLSKLGVLARGKGEVGGRWADRIWFLTTLIGLYKLHTQTIPSLPPLSKPVSVTACADRLLSPQDIANQREEERMWEKEWGDARWTGRKLVADLCFVSYDVLGLDFPLVGEPMQCVAGLVSGFISATKLYNQHWDASLGK
ncbi:hypothetical protein L202_06259 [Cryptococcus amylolentus CBS 6039]|uniref:Peroxisomal membrane protein 11C n=2 Tax=Cryptococcus amylolentus CBS 6039 TaxID=1295533 RepID=A0A1E3HFB8_9TREE|nr:hypothetical protein L202_06259 [Cryptococcus amylolentus CBS 6039]ODN75038.1 hypothetical protein L202_06259 [Cryptococcus amylolentus CBS 6039]